MISVEPSAARTPRPVVEQSSSRDVRSSPWSTRRMRLWLPRLDSRVQAPARLVSTWIKFTDKEGRHRSDQLEACASLRLPAWSRALERTVKMSLSSRVTSMCTGWQPLQLQEHVDCKRGHLRQTQALAGWVLLPELATVQTL
mmetsp:Transcript_31761/g.100972  ORF Transcript_31761/g.100972 Transcript_31761/m.100972 type:complete len:142 (-) Transcript_31761:88-513(-)